MSDTLNGGDGMDHIYGLGGNDKIWTGFDSDWNYVEGGSGNDRSLAAPAWTSSMATTETT